MSVYRCPLCNETGHTSMTCPSLAGVVTPEVSRTRDAPLFGQK